MRPEGFCGLQLVGADCSLWKTLGCTPREVGFAVRLAENPLLILRTAHESAGVILFRKTSVLGPRGRNTRLSSAHSRGTVLK